jgi:hypothetical protein
MDTSPVINGNRACNAGGHPPGPCGQGQTQVQRRRLKTVLAKQVVECSLDLPRAFSEQEFCSPCCGCWSFPVFNLLELKHAFPPPARAVH